MIWLGKVVLLEHGKSTIRAKFFQSAHTAFHCHKQWGEQFKDYFAWGCTLRMEDVYEKAL